MYDQFTFMLWRIKMLQKYPPDQIPTWEDWIRITIHETPHSNLINLIKSLKKHVPYEMLNSILLDKFSVSSGENSLICLKALSILN